MGLIDNIGSIKALNAGAYGVTGNNPAALAGRQKAYFGADTQSFIAQNAQYAADYFECQCQGILADDFFAYVPTKIRMADIAEKGTGSNLTENWKIACFSDPHIQYVSVGAKCVVGKQTFIVTNPINVSNATVAVIMRRCNASWGYLDYFGNIQYEPFVWISEKSEATAFDFSQYMVNANAYQHSYMQLNPNTAFVKENCRVILGSAAYAVRGLVDFTQEFTDTLSSNHVLSFDLYRQEPDLTQDDMVNKVAGGLVQGWSIEVNGTPSMAVGAEQTLSASALKFGVAPDTMPTILWSSSNASVASVSDSGVVTAVSAGEAVITASLQENPSIVGTLDLEIVATIADGIMWKDAPALQLRFLASTTACAAVYVGGSESGLPIEYSLTGAQSGSFGYSTNGNTITITCYAPSATPLTVTAKYGEYTQSATIELTA